MELELWTAFHGENGDGVDIVGAASIVGHVADWPTAERIVAAHNAAVYRAHQELERAAWLAEANHEAWLAAAGQNGDRSTLDLQQFGDELYVALVGLYARKFPNSVASYRRTAAASTSVVVALLEAALRNSCHDPVTGSNARSAMRHSALGRG